MQCAVGGVVQYVCMCVLGPSLACLSVRQLAWGTLLDSVALHSVRYVGGAVQYVCMCVRGPSLSCLSVRQLPGGTLLDSVALHAVHHVSGAVQYVCMSDPCMHVYASLLF